MKIPKRFKLFGETINLMFDEKLEEKTDAVGQAHYRYNEIKLNYNDKRPREYIEVTLWHEIILFILDRINEKELRENEQFVNMISQLIHQAITTMEY